MLRVRLRFRFLKDKRAVADDLSARAGGVAGIAEVNGAGAQAMPAGGLKQAANGNPTASLIVTNFFGMQSFDGLSGEAIHLARRVGIQVVTEVGANDKAGFWPIP